MPHTTLAAPAALLLDVFWKSLPVFAVAGLAALALRRASAAARHALWLLVLTGLLCLPACCLLLPRWAAPVLPAAARRPLVSAAATAPAVRPQAVAEPPILSVPQTPRAPEISTPVTVSVQATAPAPAVAASPVRPTQPPKPARLTLPNGVCLVWLVGALLVLGRTLLGLASAGRLVGRCEAVTAGPLVEAADGARHALGLTRPLSVRRGDVAVPMTCGVRRPVVLLPPDAADWPADRLRAVLLHEAAHVKRWDWPASLLAQFVCALYWPQPLTWLTARRLRAEAEGACDDLVLACGVPAPDYAGHLLEIVRGLAGRRAPLTGTVAMASRPEVAGRLRTILDSHRPRGPVTRRGLALAALAALGAVAATASVHPVARRARAAAPAPLPEATRTALLPGGVQVDLVGVDTTSPVTKRTIELTPDGVARTGGLHPGWQFLRGAMAALPQSEGVKGSYDYFIIQTDAKASYDVGSTHIVPRGGGRGDVSVTTATGDYGKLLTAPLGRTTRRTLPGGGTLTLSVNAHAPRFADWTGRHYAVTQVTVTAPAGYLDNPGCVVLPSLANGQPASVAVDRYDADHDTPQQNTFYFRTSALQAKHVQGFQFLWRPVHTLIFRDIALRPLAQPALTPLNGAKPADAGGPVQTVSYAVTAQHFDAQGRRDHGHGPYLMLGTFPPQVGPDPMQVYVRRDPPAVAKVSQPLGWEYLNDSRGVFTYTARGGYVVRRLSPAQNGRWFVSGEVNTDLSACTDVPEPSFSDNTATVTPWRERSVTFEGRAARLFSREERFDLLRPAQTWLAQEWMDTTTGRLLRAERDSVPSQAQEGRQVVTESDFRYNQPPPPGVFDWSPPPGAPVVDPREKTASASIDQAGRVIPFPHFPRPQMQHTGDPVADKKALALAVRHYNNILADFYYHTAQSVHEDDLAVGMPDGGLKIIRHGRALPGLVGAAARGDLGVITAKLNGGQSADAMDADGLTPLIAAAATGQAGSVQLLLRRGARVDARSPGKGYLDALMEAAAAGHPQVIRLLLGAGADPNAEDQQGRSPLQYAVHAEVIQTLLGAGAKVNHADKGGFTPLMLAAGYGTPASISLLLQRGADPAARDGLGRDAASYAARHGRGLNRTLLEQAVRAAKPDTPHKPQAEAPAPRATQPDDRVRFLAGLAAVQGPGVVVTLNDSKKPVPLQLRIMERVIPPPNLINDTDINLVVSALKAAGAEAIAVNGERLVAVSPIRSAGPAVMVNDTPLTPPYVIRAIGDPVQLQKALYRPGGVVVQVGGFDPAKIRVQASTLLTLPAYKGSTLDRYARPVGAASGGGARTRAFTIAFRAPRRGVHHVRIVFTDARGGHLAFDRLCPPSYSIDLPETAHGERVNFRIFDNGHLVKQQTL